LIWNRIISLLLETKHKIKGFYHIEKLKLLMIN
jgi:hypothetical protein